VKQTQLSYPAPTKVPPPHLASFKTTAAALQDAAPRIYTLRYGELVLYKRPRSRVWQYRYKLFAGQWVRVRTGKTVLEHAVRVAADRYDEARYRERLGLAPVQMSFAGSQRCGNCCDDWVFADLFCWLSIFVVPFASTVPGSFRLSPHTHL
jgi:hypothetical protein